MPRNSKGAPRLVVAADNKLKALKLRAEGYNYSEIASRLGMSRANAHRHVINALEELQGEMREVAKDVLQLELERLDELQSAIYDKAKSGRLPEIDRVLAIMARRAKLHGLEVEKKEVAVTVRDMNEAELIAEAKRLGVPIPPELLEKPAPLAIEDAEFDVRPTSASGDSPTAGGEGGLVLVPRLPPTRHD